MKVFSRALWRILEPKVFEDIFDQAATNWLVYNGRVPVENIFEINVDSGEIFTADLFLKFQRPIKIRNGKILRGDGGIPEVVHQYDRSDELILLVNELYRDKNFTFDARFTDTRSFLEQVICLLHADKIIDATRLFVRKFLSPVDWSEHVDALINIWALALRKDFSPAVETLELAAQNALLSVKRASVAQAMKVHALFVCAQENCRAVDTEFKDKFTNCLHIIAQGS